MFVKDGNEKDSAHCQFTQAADLVAYAAFLKLKGEQNRLEPWQASYSLENMYDSVPRHLLNRKVQGREPRDGIVRIP